MKKVLALICIGVLFTGVIISGAAVTGKAPLMQCNILTDRGNCNQDQAGNPPVCWVNPANEQEDCLNCCDFCSAYAMINDRYGCGCCCS